MYMSYCRFEGTHQELRACLADVDDHLMEDAEYKVSDGEINHFRQMVTDFFYWMQDNCLITADGELDDTALEGVCESMSKSYPAKEEITC